jgi:predicted AAA+ superfamily ATPase
LRSDFAKYAGRVHHGRLNAVLSSVAQQVGAKFRYTQVDRAERSMALAQAVELLSLARVCHRVRGTPATAPPLAAGVDEKRFKLILLDVGLLSACLGLSVAGLDATADLMLANRGAVAEQVVGQLLRLGFRAHEDPGLYYWHRDARGSEAEVDYVTQQGTHVVPVEVKAGTTGSHKSLHIFMAERGFPVALRFNADLPSVTQVVASTRLGTTAKYTSLSLPLYLAEEVPRLVAEVLGGRVE